MQYWENITSNLNWTAMFTMGVTNQAKKEN